MGIHSEAMVRCGDLDDIGIGNYGTGGRTGRPIDSPATNTIEAIRYPGKEMKEGFLNSAKQIGASIQADPDEAANYVGLADVQTFLWCYGFAPHAEVMPRCETAAQGRWNSIPI